MDKEREYIVIVNKGENLQQIEEEIKALTGDGFIPNRAVEVANERVASQRMTHFYLTDKEAEVLRNDPRILEVEIPIEHRDDIKIGLNAFQESDFFRGLKLDKSTVNWGLRRHTEDTNIYNGQRTSPSTPYEYAVDGTGVDVVIMDTGVQVDHPEFLDENGVSRVQQIDWYQEAGLSGTLGPNFYVDQDGHGTHCAGIAAGKTHGWAKNAHIYSIKILNGDDKISSWDAMDLVKRWHENKTNGRPTVVNMSFGTYGLGFSPYNSGENDIFGTYRGQDWVWGADLNGEIDRIQQEKGYFFTSFGYFYRYPVRSTTTDANLEEMIDAGIHVCIAAGNMPFKIDDPVGPDYNNVIYWRASSGNVYSHYYHRGSSPHSVEAINVGAIDDNMEGTSDRATYFSARGPSVDIWAAGDTIISSLPSSDYEYLTGTSMACPQVVGVIAQHLQVNPTLTPAQMKARLINDSKSVIYDTGDDTSYTNEKSLVGGPNRILYSRYGKQPYKVKGSVTYRK